jgi:hypothetical protein
MTPEDTSVQVLLLWAVALSTVINLGTVIWNIFSGPSKRNGAKLDEHAATLRLLDTRLSSIENAHRDMPKQKDFHESEMAMVALGGKIDVLTERLKPLEAVMERAQQWMMEHGNK